MSAVPISWYLILGALLFSIGAIGVLIRRNVIVIFMSIELMLNAVNLVFVAMARQLHSVDGQVIVFFVMTVAAAEAASSADSAAATPVRRPRYARTVSCALRSGSWGR